MYYIQPSSNGPQYQVYCDVVTPGGPWMLLYSYKHIGGDNNPLVENTIPTSPTTGYSHANLNIFKDGYGNSVLTAKKVRFYCETSAHTRKIHFYTANGIVDQMANDGLNTRNAIWLWRGNNVTTLSDHTAYLPTQTDAVWSPSTTLGLWNSPFFKGNNYHWNIRGFGTRFECDDWNNGYNQATLHQIWVNTGIVIINNIY